MNNILRASFILYTVSTEIIKKEFHTGRLCPEVQGINLLQTNFYQNGTPFTYISNKNVLYL